MSAVTKKLKNTRSRAISTKVSRAKNSLSRKSDEMVGLMVLGLQKGASDTIVRTSTDPDEQAEYRSFAEESGREMEKLKSRAKSR